MKSDNVVRDKSYAFSLHMLKVYRTWAKDSSLRPIYTQVLRSSTSIGANVEEAIGAQSRADFRHKISIAYKEARETEYWLRLLTDAKCVQEADSLQLLDECTELVRILGSIKKSTCN
jgi:four helix bundle protein